MVKKTKENIQKDKLLAKLHIAREDLYVYKDSPEVEKWKSLLGDAEDRLQKGEVEYASTILERVDSSTSSLWNRIKKWKENRRKVILFFSILVCVEIVLAVILSSTDFFGHNLFTAVFWGLVGGSVSVLFGTDKELVIGESNTTKLIDIVKRPVVGMTSAIFMFFLLDVNVVQILPDVDQVTSLMAVSFIAGFSERYFLQHIENSVGKLTNGSN